MADHAITPGAITPGAIAPGAIAIGTLARRSGCRIETIRYYERIGLLPAPARQGRFRRYDPGDASRLAFVRRARALGFTLGQVRALLGLAAPEGAAGAGPDACAAAQAIAGPHLADVRARLADLRRMEQALVLLLDRCAAGEQPACPLIATLSDPAVPSAPP